MRKIFIAAIVVLAALAAGHVCAAPKALALADIKKFVTEYIGDKTSGDRKTEIAKALAGADKAVLSKALSRVIATEATRAAALRLAVDFRAPNLFATVKKHADTDQEDVVLEYCMTLQERGCVEFVIDRLENTSPDDPSFMMAREALKKHGFSFDLLPSLKKFLDSKTASEPLKDAAFEIITVQLGTDAFESRQHLQDKWDEVYKRLTLFAKDFPINGDDLLALDGITMSKARRLRKNVVIERGGKVALGRIPEKYQTGNWTVRMNLYVVEGKGTKVGFQSEEGTWQPIFTGDKWEIQYRDKSRRSTKGTIGAWTLFEFSVSDDEGGERKFERILQISADGTNLLGAGGGTFNGGLKDFYVEANESQIILGGWEAVKK